MDTYKQNRPCKGHNFQGWQDILQATRQAKKKRGLTSKGGEGTVGRDEWNRWNDKMSMNRGANEDYNLAPAIATQRGGHSTGSRTVVGKGVMFPPEHGPFHAPDQPSDEPFVARSSKD